MSTADNKNGAARIAVWQRQSRDAKADKKRMGSGWKIAMLSLIVLVLVINWSKLFYLVSPSLSLPLVLLVAALVVIWILWWIPRKQAETSPEVTPDNFFDRENEARKTLAQVLGGVFLLAGLYFSANTLRVSQEGQIADRFSKAVEQLGAANVDPSTKQSIRKWEVRIGAIYALAEIAGSSNDYYWPIMDVLTAYVRKYSPVGSAPSNDDDEVPIPRIDPDIQAIITVLGHLNRSSAGGRKLDLSSTNLVDADLRDGNFNFVNLNMANLKWAKLNRTSLQRADLRFAQFKGENFAKTDFTGANVVRTQFLACDLHDTNLSPDQLKVAELGGGTIRPR